MSEPALQERVLAAEMSILALCRVNLSLISALRQVARMMPIVRENRPDELDLIIEEANTALSEALERLGPNG